MARARGRLLREAPEVKAALELDPVMALIECAPETSRLPASRRVFTEMNKLGATVPVIHHMVFAEGAVGDDIVIQSGAQAGGLLCDGLGDGVMIEAPGAELD